MRQRVLVGGLWVLAAILAMAVVNRGIAAVHDVAGGTRTTTIAVPDQANPPGAVALGIEQPSTDLAADRTDALDPASAPTPTTSTTTIVPTTTAVVAVTTTARIVAEADKQSQVTLPPTTTTRPPVTTTTTVVPTTTVAAALNATHVTSAGTAWVLYSPDSVTLDTAIPDDGYHTEVKQLDALTVEIHFESNEDSHKVVLIATWSDGPSHSIDESGD